MILKIYRYLFYKFYCWAVYLHGETDAPCAAALCAIVFFGSFNLYTFFLFITIFTGINVDQAINNTIHITKGAVISVLMVAMFLFHIFFVKNNVYRGIIKKFKYESAEKKRRGNIFIGCYVVISIVLFILFMCIAKCAHYAGFTVINYLHSL